MEYNTNEIYHLYNRGINKKPIFRFRKNYEYFLRGVEKRWKPNFEILAYCLMPNHFHFLVQFKEFGLMPSNAKGSAIMNNASASIKNQLSGYAKAFNKQECRTGSLFQQNTRIKQVSSSSIKDDYAVWCFIYIHINPVKSGLVSFSHDWPFSSVNEYIYNPKNSIVNLDLGRKLLGVNENRLLLYEEDIHDKVIEKFY